MTDNIQICALVENYNYIQCTNFYFIFEIIGSKLNYVNL